PLPPAVPVRFPPAGNPRPAGSPPRRGSSPPHLDPPHLRDRGRPGAARGRALRPHLPALDLRDPGARQRRGPHPQEVVGPGQGDVHPRRQLPAQLRPPSRSPPPPAVLGGDVLNRHRPLRTGIGGRRGRGCGRRPRSSLASRTISVRSARSSLRVPPSPTADGARSLDPLWRRGRGYGPMTNRGTPGGRASLVLASHAPQYTTAAAGRQRSHTSFIQASTSSAPFGMSD